MKAIKALARTPLRALTLVLALTVAVGTNSASADDPAAEARSFLKTFSDQAVAALANGGLSPSERESTLKTLISNGFEIDTIGRLALGRHWKSATDSQRSEFKALFENYVTTATIRRLSDYSGEVLEIGRARTASNADLVSVASQIRNPNGGALGVEWRLRRTADADWRIIDVVIEGVSMLQTHRAEFDAVIRSKGAGLEGLLDKLRSITRA